MCRTWVSAVVCLVAAACVTTEPAPRAPRQAEAAPRPRPVVADAGGVDPGSHIQQRDLADACDARIARSCRHAASEAFHRGDRAAFAHFAQRACELQEDVGCDMLQRLHAEAGDLDAADRWATAGCRLGSLYGCRYLIARGHVVRDAPPAVKRYAYEQACDAANPVACRVLAELTRADEPVLRTLVDAVARQDVAALRRITDRNAAVILSDLWFTSPSCRGQFGSALLTTGHHAAFLACLAPLRLRVAPDVSTHGAPAIQYEPGATLEVQVDDGVLRRIAGPPPYPTSPVPSISSTALASHLIAGSHTIEVPSSVRDRHAALQNPAATSVAALRVCVDATGKLETAEIKRDRSTDPELARAVEAAAAGWRFKPFVIGNQAVPICALDIFTYPAGRRGTALRDDSPRNVPPSMLDEHRVSGQKAILPDDDTKSALAGASSSKLVASFKLCVSATGDVSTVNMLKSSGFAAYDRKLQNTMRTWRYLPVWIEGIPAPVCTAVTFIYNQS